MNNTLTQTRTLESGYDMPVLGLGTWEMQGPSCERAVAEAIDIGYRAIDTAELYGNEEEIGRGIGGCPREDLFITSKVSHEHLTPVNIMAACQASLERLHTNYLDLYLIHCPNDAFPLDEAIGAMNELVRQGWVRSIGVSNFNRHRLEQAIDHSKKPVCVNQIEYHPYAYRPALPAYCEDHKVAVIAYSPLARGKILEDHTLVEIGRGYGKSAAQVSLKWLLQQGCLIIPKASRVEHLQENADMDDWELTPEEMHRIDSIDIDARVVDHMYT